MVGCYLSDCMTRKYCYLISRLHMEHCSKINFVVIRWVILLLEILVVGLVLIAFIVTDNNKHDDELERLNKIISILNSADLCQEN